MLCSALRVLLIVSAFLPLAVMAEAQPEQWFTDQPFNPQRGRIGIHVQPMTKELREYFKAPEDRGLLVSAVEKDRPAARAGLRAGDVILAAGGAPMREPLDLVKAVAKVPEGKVLDLELLRDGSPLEVEVRPEGVATPWIDPEYWGEWLQRGLQQGSEQLRRQLEEMQKRLEDLERRFNEQQEENGEKQRT